MRAFLKYAAVTVAVIAAFFSFAYWFVGTPSFAEFLRPRIEKTVSEKLGRALTIGRIEITRGRTVRVVVRDVKVANFAAIREIDLVARIESVVHRRIRIDRIDVRAPEVNVEIDANGNSNVPGWKSEEGGADIVRVTIGTVALNGGTIRFLDRKHGLVATVAKLATRVDIKEPQIVDAVVTTPAIHLQAENYAPVDLDLQATVRYAGDNVTLRSLAVRGKGINAAGSARFNTAEKTYQGRLRADVGLDRVREILQTTQALDGTITLDTTLRGNGAKYGLRGTWRAPHIQAASYQLDSVRGKLAVTDKDASVSVDSASYAGGTIAAQYKLGRFDEPYPMSLEFGFVTISLEQLLADIGTKNNGLRGHASGKLAYAWNNNRLLAGDGAGSMTLAPATTTAFSNATYPLEINGSTEFAIERGVVRFGSTALATGASQINVSGSVGLADAAGDLTIAIHSSDFAELDRTAFNFARAAGKNTWELLGLGGEGAITATVKGPLKNPVATVVVAATGTRYKNAELGKSDIEVSYDTAKSSLALTRATFEHASGRLAAAGTVGFPARGPSPAFSVQIDANAYPAERLIAASGFAIKGIRGGVNGRVNVDGTPDAGEVRFQNVTLAQDASEVRANGSMQWMKGAEPRFDIDAAAQAFPIADLLKAAGAGDIATGEVNGTLRVSGTQSAIEGTGSLSVHNGVVYGEPLDSVDAEIAFTPGVVRATKLAISAPAGAIHGEAEIELATKKFRYSIESSAIDLSKLKILKSEEAAQLALKLALNSTGSGTLDEPKLSLAARLSGSAGDLLTVNGDATIAANRDLNGTIRVVLPDLARLGSAAVAGRVETDVQLGGSLTSLDRLRIDGTVPVFDVQLAGTALTPVRPIRYGLRDGSVVVDDCSLTHAKSLLDISGIAHLTGDRQLDMKLASTLDPALLQFVSTDMHAEGSVQLAIAAGGTVAKPTLEGSLEIQNAQLKPAGFPQSIDKINGTIKLTTEQINIQSLTAEVGGGTIEAGGEIVLQNLAPQSFKLTAKAANVTLRNIEGFTLGGGGNLELRGDPEHMIVRGNVEVSKGVYSRDIDIATAVIDAVLSPRAVSVEKVAASWKDHVGLDVKISAKNTLAVKNNIADVSAKANIQMHGTLANPTITGLVTLSEDGRIHIQDNDYRVASGTINFQNPFRIDPFFDITLEGRLPTGISSDPNQTGPVDVTINLNGTMDRFTPTITSNPPVSDLSIFSLLGLSGVDQSNRTGTSATGGAPVGFVTQSLVAHSVLQDLPFAGSISYDPGIVDQVEDPGPKVTFRRQFPNDFLVVIIYNLERSHSRSRIDWQATPDWTLQFTRDEVRKEYRFEARVRRRYLGHWTWGRETIALSASALPLVEQTDAHQVFVDALPQAGEGTTVTDVRFRPDAKFDTSRLGAYVSIKKGDTLTIRALQRSIRTLYATGDFRDVRVETTGAVVTFALLLADRVAAVDVNGLHLRGSKRDAAMREVTVGAGDAVSLDEIDRSASGLASHLNKNGYLEAVVDAEARFDPARRRAVVDFNVSQGPLASVAAVEIDGQIAPFTKEQLIGRMKCHPGKAFNRARVRADVERMQKLMLEAEHRKAEVRYLGETYDAATHKVALHFSATAGPKVRVEINGVPRKVVRGVPAVRKSQPFSDDVVADSAETMVQIYQRRGHYNASVEVQSAEEKDGTLVTTFNVRPGPKFRVASLTFLDNEKVSDAQLSRIVSATPQGGIVYWFSDLFHRAGVTDAQIANDRAALESHYLLRGFSEVDVRSPVVQADAKKGMLAITHQIIEGPQTVVTSVTVHGDEALPSSLPRLQVVKGEPLNPRQVRGDVLALQTYYSDRGKTHVRITAKPEVSKDKTSATVAYVINEGPTTNVGAVTVRGNTYTQSDVVLQQAALEPGQPFSYTSLLEAQRNLFRLGVFQRADVQPGQATTAADQRDVVVQVEEGKVLTVSASAGVTAQSQYQTSLIGSLSIANTNLFGTGRSLTLNLIGSIPNEERNEGSLSYREPFVGRYKLPLTFNLFTSEELRAGATIDKRGASIETTRAITRRTRWSLRYEYVNSLCVDGNLCDVVQPIPGLNPNFTDEFTSAITPTFFWERRDDPIDPHNGYIASVSLQYAFPLSQARSSFLKEYGQFAYYMPVTKQSVFAIASRIGFIEGLGETKSNDCAATGSCVPLMQRFTSGGESTHRAYPLDLLGDLCADPNDPVCKPTLIDAAGTLSPIGGRSVFITNLEYRFPLFSTVSGALFTDIGNVFADNKIRFDALHYGAGTGIRYLSPVGPLRFDIGWNLHRKPYEKPFAYFLTFGYAF